MPSLHVNYKKSRIKQYHKEGQALRTETTINDTRNFAIGRHIENLQELRKIGFRPTDVCSMSNGSAMTASSAKHLSRTCKDLSPWMAAALRFADPRVQALLHVLLLFVLVQGTFAHRDLREHLAPLLGQKPSQLNPGPITYDLRRLRLHGLIERIPKSYRYRITAKGLRTAIFYTRRAPDRIGDHLAASDRLSVADCQIHPRGGTGRQQLVRRRKIGSMKTWPISSIKLSIKDSSGERWKRFQRHW